MTMYASELSFVRIIFGILVYPSLSEIYYSSSQPGLQDWPFLGKFEKSGLVWSWLA